MSHTESFNKPAFITFTGVDERTSIDQMRDLSSCYPVEFGVLISDSREGMEGQNRFPSFDYIYDRLQPHVGGLQMAAHVCGGMARHIVKQSPSRWEDTAAQSCFSRIQINTADLSDAEFYRVVAFSCETNRRIILQTRDEFPVAGAPRNSLAQWLFDKSGGNGIEPDVWPSYRGLNLVGYAGGLKPDNVAQAVRKIGALAANYWIDMESGVRTDDWFDIAKCEAVCRAVYGDA